MHRTPHFHGREFFPRLFFPIINRAGHLQAMLERYTVVETFEASHY